MGSRLNPYLCFRGDARAAMSFYQEVFGGTLTSMTFGEFGAEDPELAGQIMHAQLETPAGYTLMGSDTPPGMDYTPGSAITVSLSGDDAEELRGYWKQLAGSGTVTVELDKQMWGDEFGSCVDRFGTSWLVNIGSAQS